MCWARPITRGGVVTVALPAGRPGDFAALSDEELDGRLIATLMERGMTEPQAREFINRVPIRGL
jgi:hypothetical protein